MKSKLVAVKAWRDRYVKDPLGEARKAFEVVEQFGYMQPYLNHFPRPNDRLMDAVAVSMLGRSLSYGGLIHFDELVRIRVADPPGIRSSRPLGQRPTIRGPGHRRHPEGARESRGGWYLPIASSNSTAFSGISVAISPIYQDKVVAKQARREALKVRRRLANRGR